MSRTSTVLGWITTGSLLVATSFAAGCGDLGDGAADQPVGVTTAALSASCLPALPDPSLAAPAGNRLAFSFDATGVQIYACQATATTPAWVFQAPQATLFDRHGRVAGTHFAGPTWQANDGSQVVGARVAGFTPDPTAIPWLLLSAASHSGHGRMSRVTFIQRLEAAGGIAPPAASCDAAHVGAVANVPYAATYFFYRAGGDDDGDDRGSCGSDD